MVSAKTAKKKPKKVTRKAEAATPGAERSRDALLEAGKHLFANLGYDGTTVKDISERAGVNISLVSYYFQGKEGLYRACLEPFGKSRLLIAQRILEIPTTLEECKIRLRMFVEEMFNWFNDEPELNRMIQREIESNLPIAEDVFKKTFLKVFETCENFLKKSQSKGHLRDDCDMHIMTGLIFGSLQYKLRTCLLEKHLGGYSFTDPKQQKKLVDQFLQIFFEGIENRLENRIENRLENRLENKLETNAENKVENRVENKKPTRERLK